MTTHRTERGLRLRVGRWYVTSEGDMVVKFTRLSSISAGDEFPCLAGGNWYAKDGRGEFTDDLVAEVTIRRVLVIDHPRGKTPRRAGGKAGRGGK